MIGTLTSDYETGVKIKEILDKDKYVKHSENISYIYGLHDIVYLYSNDEEKETHKDKMCKEGWTAIEGQSHVHIYANFHDKRKILVPCAIYEKEVARSIILK